MLVIPHINSQISFYLTITSCAIVQQLACIIEPGNRPKLWADYSKGDNKGMGVAVGDFTQKEEASPSGPSTSKAAQTRRKRKCDCKHYQIRCSCKDRPRHKWLSKLSKNNPLACFILQCSISSHWKSVQLTSAHLGCFLGASEIQSERCFHGNSKVS